MNRIKLSLIPMLIAFGLNVRSQDINVKPGMWFTENTGFYDTKVKFGAGMKGLHFYMEDGGFTYKFYNEEDLAQLTGHVTEGVLRKPGDPYYNTVRYHVVKTKFVDANPYVETIGEDAKEFYYNYFLGSDPSKWRSYVQNYSAVKYKNLWAGVDMHMYVSGSNMKYDYIVHPGADVSKIKVKYYGADRIEQNSGNIYIVTSQGTIIEQKPYVYQYINGVKKEVESAYVYADNTLSFVFPKGYNPDVDLIIDPTLVASTFSGSTMDNWGTTAAYDAAGNIYTGGTTSNYYAGTYPVTVGAYDLSFNGGNSTPNLGHPCDITIDKFNPTATARIYATFLGGSANERAHSIIVNSNNELYIFSVTHSTNFPVTVGAYDQTQNGGTDLAVTALNATGSNLIGSTYVGGTLDDGVNYNGVWTTFGNLKYNYSDESRGEIDLDANGNVFVGACTKSNNFPTTPGAIDNSLGGTQDGVVFKLNPTLTNLLWSTYLGGSADDAVYAVNINTNGSIYVAGGTMSADFPTTPGVIKTTLGGTHDGFISYINNSGTTLLKSTYIGTTSYDQIYFIQTDKYNAVYIYGQTEGNWTTTPGVYQVPNGKMFVQKVDSALGTVQFSTRFGPTTNQLYPTLSPTAFLVDTCLNIYCSGWGRCAYWGTNVSMPKSTTGTSTMPVTSNALQTTTDGCDFYYYALARNGTKLAYATYFGSNIHEEHVDGGTSRFDKNGVLYQSICAGCGGGTGTFITTPGAVSSTNACVQNCNLGVNKLAFQLGKVTATSAAPSVAGCLQNQVCFTNTSTGAGTIYYLWDFGDGTPLDTNKSPCHSYANVGTYTVTLVAIDSLSCNLRDTTYLTATVYPAVTVSLPPDTTVCSSTIGIVLTGPNSPNPPTYTYTWTTPSGSATTQTITATQVGSYTLTVNNGYCSDADIFVINQSNPVTLNIPDTAFCLNSTFTYLASACIPPLTTWSWSTGDTTCSISVTSPGSYTVVAMDSLGCSTQDVFTVGTNPLPNVNINGATQCTINHAMTASGGVSYSWMPGGATTPTITATTAGTYTVWVTDSKGCSSSDTALVQQAPFPNVNVNGFSVCTFTSSSLNAGPGFTTYTWQPGNQTTQSITVTTSGVYTVTVTNAFGCTDSDTAIVIQNAPPSVNVADAYACNSPFSVTLNAGTTGVNYSWTGPGGFTGNTQTVTATQTGNYTITVSAPNDPNCKSSDTLTVYNYMPHDVQDASLCLVDVQTVTATPIGGTAWPSGTLYSWAPGGQTTSSITVSGINATYTVTVVVPYGTGNCVFTDQFTITELPGGYSLDSVPNVFTPNGDGINETFTIGFKIPTSQGQQPQISISNQDFSVMIFNRWGNKIFETDSPYQPWDGKSKGSDVPDGTYYYIVKFYDPCMDKHHEKVGFVHVMR